MWYMLHFISHQFNYHFFVLTSWNISFYCILPENEQDTFLSRFYFFPFRCLCIAQTDVLIAHIQNVFVYDWMLYWRCGLVACLFKRTIHSSLHTLAMRIVFPFLPMLPQWLRIYTYNMYIEINLPNKDCFDFFSKGRGREAKEKEQD